MRKKAQKIVKYLPAEVLREIATYDSIRTAEHPLEYLCWFLKTCYQLFTKADQFLYANVQYFDEQSSIYTKSQVEWKDWIPTLYARQDNVQHEFQQTIKGAIAFLGVLRRSSEEGIPYSAKVFTEKLIFEIVRSQNGHVSAAPVVYDERAKILTVSLPDLYDSSVGSAFINIDDKGMPFIKEETQDYYVLDGKRFIELIDAQQKTEQGNRLLKRFEGFLKKYHRLIQDYQRMILTELNGKGIDFDAAECKRFIVVGLIHSWLKPTPCSYLIPLASAGSIEMPRTVVTFLIGTKRQLTIDKLNLLHAALNMALWKLRQYELTARELSSSSDQKNTLGASQSIGTELFSSDKPDSESWRTYERHGMICRSPSTQIMYQQIELLAEKPHDILIVGEIGTGKRVVAKAIHELSNRRSKLFVAVQAAEIAPLDFEKKLNEYVAQANGGTLFFNGIDLVSPDVRDRLLFLLKSRARRGSNADSMLSTVRVVCSSNRKMKIELFDWFKEWTIEVPPLRDRKEDLPLLVDYFLDHYERRLNIQENVKQKLCKFDWSNRNVRELGDVIMRAYVNAYDDGEIREEHIERILEPKDKYPLDRRLTTVLSALRKNAFNIKKTLLMLEEELFSLSRKTVVGYCRELCMLMLANNQWDLEQAVNELAGNDALVPKAAQKFMDYLFGDKKDRGIFQYLSQQEEVKQLVRKRSKSMLVMNEFVERYRKNEISAQRWLHILKRYYGVSGNVTLVQLN